MGYNVGDTVSPTFAEDTAAKTGLSRWTRASETVSFAEARVWGRWVPPKSEAPANRANSRARVRALQPSTMLNDVRHCEHLVDW